MGTNIIWGFLIWQFNYILQIYVLIKHNLPIYFIGLNFIGLIVGGIFALKVVNKMNHHFAFLLFVSLLVLFFILLLSYDYIWFVPIGIFGAGFCIGTSSGLFNLQCSFAFKDPNFGGRIYSMGFVGLTFLALIELFLFLSNNFYLIRIYFLFILILFFILTLLGKEEDLLPAQNHVNIRKYLREESKSWIGLAFFWGLFFANTYYAALLILEQNNLLDHLYFFFVILFITIGGFTFLCGLICDIIGRRLTLLIGLTVQALAFLILSFVQIKLYHIVIFGVILGIGSCMSMIPAFCIFVELPEKEYIRDKGSLYFIVGSIGSLCGVILGELLRPLYIEDPAYLTLILLFIFVCATIVMFQL
jgi:hypothetical protein